jgi:8-oxo-dGTP pyrophosphatase MutT (NUDIX family)
MSNSSAVAAGKGMRVATTVLLLRDGVAGMEIFMVQRHHQIEFASGALVFPGGSMDPGDRAVASDPVLVADAGGLDTDTLAIRIGGIRETFEESGILLARPRGSDALLSASELARVEPQREALDEGRVSFGDLLRQHGLVPAIDLLVPFAHWITPVDLPKRFDTYFLLALAPPDQVGRHDGRESVDSIWLSPREALQGAESGRFTLPFPTIRNLIKLDKLGSVRAALDFARSTPVVTVVPEMTRLEGGGHRLRIPREAGYDGEVFDVQGA